MRRGTDSNNGNHYSSYQTGGTISEQQNNTLQDTTTAYYQADDTANHVLERLSAQRTQLEHATGHVDGMQNATAQAQLEMRELRKKIMEKKQRLYFVIGMLTITDLFLFWRIVHCGGNFYCF